MTRNHVAERVRRLMALAAVGSGATEQEARTAALTAVRTMLAHGLVPGDGRPSAIDLDEVAALAFHAAELERLLVAERAAHATELRARDEHWKNVVENIRYDADVDRRRAAKAASSKGAAEEREARARAGARGRDQKLDAERKTEIARTAATARWARWRERHGVTPR